jgi:putative RNA 2'-phosphotransferase
MKSSNRITDLSKWLSYVLRHHPSSAGLTLDSAGWIGVDLLLEVANRGGHQMNQTELEEVVASSDKQRFAFNADRTQIRANQGHSIPVDLQLPVMVPPAILFHGTAERFIDSILCDGLRPRQRHHVHLSADPKTAVSVGGRHGKPVVLHVDAARMHADGHVFRRSENGVWLAEHVPPTYLSWDR